jgi:hypothetical protein
VVTTRSERLEDRASGGGPSTSEDAAELGRRVYGGYFLLQAVAGIGFWVAVAAVPAVRRVFEMSSRQHAVTDSYLFADIAIGIIGSAVAGAGLWRGARWGAAVALFVAGGMVYATIYLIGWVSFTGDGGGLLALMVVPSTLSAWCAAQSWRLHRPSTP